MHTMNVLPFKESIQQAAYVNGRFIVKRGRLISYVIKIMDFLKLINCQ